MACVRPAGLTDEARRPKPGPIPVLI